MDIVLKDDGGFIITTSNSIYAGNPRAPEGYGGVTHGLLLIHA